MLSRNELHQQLAEYLETLFEIPADSVTEDAHLIDDFGLDSIDTVDLLVKLRELTGRRIKAEDFKTVRTVGDVLDNIETLLATDAPASD